MADIETRIAATEKAMTSLSMTATDMSVKGKEQFKAATANVKEKANALRKSIESARKANEQEWDAARAQVARDYEAYASALAHVDAAAGLAPSNR